MDVLNDKYVFSFKILFDYHASGAIFSSYKYYCTRYSHSKQALNCLLVVKYRKYT